MVDWWVLYLQLSIGVLWVLVLVFSCYLYTIIRARGKVLDQLYVAAVWVAFVLVSVLVTVYALAVT
jgi:hypothetical protein